MTRKFAIYLIVAVLLSTTHDAPAPIAEESPTPAATPKPKPKPRPKPTASESSERNVQVSKVVSATFVTKDTVTNGNWLRTYGGDGYSIANLAANCPRYATATAFGEASYTWANSTNDVRGLAKPGSTTDRFAGCWYSSSSFSVDLNLTDGLLHRVALYCVDWDGFGRSQTIEIVDAANNAVLSSEAVTGFHGGQYLIWNVRGHVVIRFTNNAGFFANAVLSGLFFDTRK
jgi:hypothetical protein